MSNKKEFNENRTAYMPFGMCLGMSIGVAIGAATDNLALYMCLGMSIGMSIGCLIDAKKWKKSNDTSEEETEETE